jgi:hypothetical protein
VALTILLSARKTALRQQAARSAIKYRAGELAADHIIHMMGTLAGAVGSPILVGIAAAMLGCSAAYNLASNISRVSAST